MKSGCPNKKQRSPRQPAKLLHAILLKIMLTLNAQIIFFNPFCKENYKKINE